MLLRNLTDDNMHCSFDLLKRLLCVTAILLFVEKAAVAGQFETRPKALPIGMLAQASLQDPLDCPLLPSCPGESFVPLPPVLAPTEPSTKGPAPAVDGTRVLEGTGRYNGMVLIPAGTFEMGSPDNTGRPDERPVQNIFVREFYISKHQVTAREFSEFLSQKGEVSKDGTARVKLDCADCPIVKNGKKFEPREGFEDKPAVCVSWYSASEYAQWAGGRLPTSAEWEKAALLTTPYPPGDSLVLLPRDSAVPVQTADSGLRGITGMMGNVWEWCSDWYARDYYAQNPGPNPPGASLGQEKVIRGGSWSAAECSRRIKNRHKAAPRGHYRTVGFRIVKDSQ